MLAFLGTQYFLCRASLNLSTSLSHMFSLSLFFAYSLIIFLLAHSLTLSPVLPFFYTIMLSCAPPFSSALIFSSDHSFFLHLHFLAYSHTLHPCPCFLVFTISPTLTLSLLLCLSISPSCFMSFLSFSLPQSPLSSPSFRHVQSFLCMLAFLMCVCSHALMPIL